MVLWPHVLPVVVTQGGGRDRLAAGDQTGKGWRRWAMKIDFVSEVVEIDVGVTGVNVVLTVVQCVREVPREMTQKSGGSVLYHMYKRKC